MFNKSSKPLLHHILLFKFNKDIPNSKINDLGNAFINMKNKIDVIESITFGSAGIDKYNYLFYII